MKFSYEFISYKLRPPWISKVLMIWWWILIASAVYAPCQIRVIYLFISQTNEDRCLRANVVSSCVNLARIFQLFYSHLDAHLFFFFHRYHQMLFRRGITYHLSNANLFVIISLKYRSIKFHHWFFLFLFFFLLMHINNILYHKSV